jgi:Family of unknown function (DUF6499)
MLGQFIAPDWRDAKQYPDPRQASPSHWAWEFLRRNKEYQEDWARFAGNLLEMTREYPETKNYLERYLAGTDEARIKLRAKFTTKREYEEYCDRSEKKLQEIEWDEVDGRLLSYNPPRIEGETYADYAKRSPSHKNTPLAIVLGEKWGIHQIKPPASIYLSIFGIDFTHKKGNGAFYPNVDFRESLQREPASERPQYALDLVNDLGERLGRSHLKTVTFNLALPLEPQMKNVLADLKVMREMAIEGGEFKMKKGEKIQRGELYCTYLRSYDAHVSGVPANEIANALQPEKAYLDTHNSGKNQSKSATSWINRAKELIEGQYAALPVGKNVT